MRRTGRPSSDRHSVRSRGPGGPQLGGNMMKRLALVVAVVAASLFVPAAPASAHTACTPYASDPVDYVVATALCAPANQIHGLEHRIEDLGGGLDTLIYYIECLNHMISSPGYACPPQV